MRINKKDKKKPGQTVPSISVYDTPRSVTDFFNEASGDVDDSESISDKPRQLTSRISLRMD